MILSRKNISQNDLFQALHQPSSNDKLTYTSQLLTDHLYWTDWVYMGKKCKLASPSV